MLFNCFLWSAHTGKIPLDFHVRNKVMVFELFVSLFCWAIHALLDNVASKYSCQLLSSFCKIFKELKFTNISH